MWVGTLCLRVSHTGTTSACGAEQVYSVLLSFTRRETLPTACGCCKMVCCPELVVSVTLAAHGPAEHTYADVPCAQARIGDAGEVVVLRQLREVEILKSPAVILIPPRCSGLLCAACVS